MNEDNLNDIVNTFKQMMSNNSVSSNENSGSEDTQPNLNISPELLSSFFNSSNSESNGLDIDTILKIKSIMESFNSKDDPRTNLLYSLKPYLRESRKKKIDEYANLLKLSDFTNLFKTDKGDSK